MNVQNLDYISTRELLNKYGVSSVTVAKWITDTLAGKTGLKYEIIGKRCRFFDIAENWQIFDNLGAMATNKRNQIFREETEPTEKFYSLFNEDEILEIARDLELRSMINVKFTYRGIGAENWDQFYNGQYGGEKYKVPVWTEEVLNYYLKLVAAKLLEYDEVNVIDLGCGNGKPIIKFLAKLKEIVPVKRYIAVDISQELLDIAKDNVKKSVPGLEYFTFKKDLEKDRLGEIFATGREDGKKVINLITILGVLLPNTYDAEVILKNIQKSMNANDVLLIDGLKSRPENNLNFAHVSSKNEYLAKQELWIPEALGINIDMCEYVAEFDPNNMQKVRYIILDKDYFITFTRADGTKITVNLKKKSKLILWFAFQTTSDSYRSLLSNTNFILSDTVSLPTDMHFLVSTRSESSRVKSPFLGNSV